MKPISISEQMMFNTVRLQAGSSFGTGFFYDFKIDDKIYPTIITNKHVVNNKEIEVWSKPLKDGSIAVGLFNLSDNKQDISIFWDQLNIQGKQKVRNLWEQKDKGVYINKYQSDVPSHGVLFIKIEPVK
mgnify:CR=1 FL=1